ncbi:Ig-like domain-containing protein [Edaphovirga cremea]|uniref:Ig-like domain-containing protein n=1 Tax=Edaphovirga cremea TaxID=2267246 RepID=UPI000DEF97B1|nr:Ig-like domain-containing protein [Edaphovirga cremea]
MKENKTMASGNASLADISSLTSQKTGVHEYGDSTTLTATVVDMITGAPMEGEVVSWSVNVGNLTQSTVTDINGQALNTYSTPSDIATGGLANITATLSNGNSAQLSLHILPAPPR